MPAAVRLRLRSSGSRGFSAVELIVATALTLILAGGIITVFVGSSTTQSANDRLAQMQQSGRLALDVMARDIRAAGYSGCTSNPRHTSSSLGLDSSDWEYPQFPVRGYQNGRSGTSLAELDPRIATQAALDSDVLVVNGPAANARTLRLRQGMVAETDALVVEKTTDAHWQTGQIVLAADCEAHAYFSVSALLPTEVRHEVGAEHNELTPRINSTAALGYVFRAGTELIPMQTTTYFIAPAKAQPYPSVSLWRRAGSRIEEVVTGVEQMQLQFGVDPDEGTVADTYVNADAVQDWNTVRSVSIALLVATPEKGSSEPETLQLLDVRVDGKRDGLKRQVFSTVITLRNRSDAN